MRFIRPLISRNHFHRMPLLPKGMLIPGQDPARHGLAPARDYGASIPWRSLRSFQSFQGLGELGDEMGMMTALPDLVSRLKSLIIAHGGPVFSGGLTNNLSLPAVMYAASNLYANASAGNMGPQAQQYWEAFRAQAENQNSPDNIYWVLARCINRWADKLIPAANDQINSGTMLDANASRCIYTLMDTTQQGTTWIGGTVTTSKLDNSQWGAVFEVAFNTIAKGVAAGLLPFTYLNVLIKAFCTDQVSRRFPAWSPPYSNLVQLDPRAAAFRAMMKQLGWNSVTKLWFTYTQQAWVEQDAAWEATDNAYMGAITALSYASGEAVFEKIQQKIQDYFAVRADTITAINQFKQMQAGPLAASVPAADAAAMDALQKQFADTDMKVNAALAPLGLWPTGASPGLSFLGVAQLIIGGVVAIGILGLVVWAISLMTATSRSAAAQTKETADKVLATVDSVKASAQRVYDASAKTPADEEQYQKALLATGELIKTIPLPPSGSDPLGLKYVAILGVLAIGGLIAWKTLGKKS